MPNPTRDPANDHLSSICKKCGFREVRAHRSAPAHFTSPADQCLAENAAMFSALRGWSHYKARPWGLGFPCFILKMFKISLVCRMIQICRSLRWRRWGRGSSCPLIVGLAQWVVPMSRLLGMSCDRWREGLRPWLLRDLRIPPTFLQAECHNMYQ